MHAAPTAVHMDLSPEGQSDPLGKFTKHRLYSCPLAQALMRDPETRDVGRAIANCALRLQLDVPLGEDGQLGEPLLKGARVCNRRLCPFCEWRRTRVWRARLINGLSAFSAEYPKHRGLFLTLTVKNCQVHELRDTIRHMHQSLKRLTQVAAWPTEFWLRRTEITVSLSRSGSALELPGSTESALPPGGGAIQSVHPHMHCLLLVPPSYFGKGYVKQLRWQQEWQMAARLDYPPVVDVRAAKVHDADNPAADGLPVSAVLEAAKYASKATDLLQLRDALPAFHHEMRGLRLYGISKSLQRYVSAADVTAGDLLDTALTVEQPQGAHLSAVAQWFDDSQEYRFVA